MQTVCAEMRISVKIRFFTRKICASHKLEMRKEAAQEWKINMKELIIDRLGSNQRLDKYLAKYLSAANKSFIYKMLRKKNITLNNKKKS